MNKYAAYLFRQCVVLSIVVCICCGISAYMDEKLDVLYEKHQTRVNHVNGFAVKDKGNALVSRSLADKGNILVMGSSELGLKWSITTLMPNRYYRGDVSAVGHAHVQNFHHAMNLGANYEHMKNTPIVVMEGFQWFMGSNPAIEGFFSTFSQQQFYAFLENDKISEANKRYLCKRYVRMENMHETRNFTGIKKTISHGSSSAVILDSLVQIAQGLNWTIVDGEIEYPTTYILARLYAADNVFSRGICFLIRPYYFLKDCIMGMKDKSDSLKWLCKVDRNNIEEKGTVEFSDWDALYASGAKAGMESCTNNNIYVYDEYYEKYLQSRWSKLKSRDQNTKLMVSSEWDDYKFLLDVCNDLGVKPYIVLQSTNGWYYDYIGMTKDKRDEVYSKQEEMAKEYDMPYLTLRDKEYEPYFYCDVMHLGWKGWPYVTQNIVEHFAK